MYQNVRTTDSGIVLAGHLVVLLTTLTPCTQKALEFGAFLLDIF